MTCAMRQICLPSQAELSNKMLTFTSLSLIAILSIKPLWVNLAHYLRLIRPMGGTGQCAGA